LLIRPNLLNRISSGHFHCSQISHDLWAGETDIFYSGL
jgi:hypothetical protein